jgi:hypothetical protein
VINLDITHFVASWNHHRIQIRDGPNQLPIALFATGNLTQGIRGDPFADLVDPEDIETFGVDWEALCKVNVMGSHCINNPPKPPAPVSVPWYGRHSIPPLETLSNVVVETADSVMTELNIALLLDALLWLVN